MDAQCNPDQHFCSMLAGTDKVIILQILFNPFDKKARPANFVYASNRSGGKIEFSNRKHMMLTDFFILFTDTTQSNLTPFYDLFSGKRDGLFAA